MSWLTIVLLIAAALAVAWWSVRRPVRHRNVSMDGFVRFFGAWIPKLANGGLIFVREDASKHFAQFGIYRSDNDAVVQFAFPDAAWSSSVFDAVHSALRKAGFDVRLEPTEVKEVRRFLVCDLPAARDSIARDAADVARIALTAMGHDASQNFTLWCEGDFGPKAAVESLERLTEHPNMSVRKWAEGRLARLNRE